MEIKSPLIGIKEKGKLKSLKQDLFGENIFDVCIILKFLSESSHIKYIESHGKNQMLNVFLNAVKSRYDLQLSSI